MKRIALSVLLFLFLLSPGVVFSSAVRCVSRNGLRACVQMKGPCELPHLLPGSTSDLRMDLLYVTIFNESNRKVRISPLDFYGITRAGIVITVDAPLYDSIEWKAKLKKTVVGPQEKLEGYLFFPRAMGSIETLVYAGNPFFEVLLF